MDQSSNVNLSSADASVSTIPTATPIASEIISDFEPDPKFEITPLEKATFDCTDLFLQDNNSSDYVQQDQPPPTPPQLVEHNGRTADEKLQHAGHVSGPQSLSAQQALSDDKPAAKITGTVGNGSDSKTSGTAQQIVEKNIASLEPSEQPFTSQNNISSKKNDCPSSLEKHDSGTEHLTATISIEESIAASALVQVAEGQAIRADVAESHLKKDSNSNQHQQYSAIETPQQAGPVHTTEESEHANYLFSLSQTSVDAQMEKVIENIVELGEGHEFSHSLSQIEDREKLLESIHRDMTGVQSSIDLIADVASKQQSIEIHAVQPDKACKAAADNGSDDSEPTQHRNEDLIANSSSKPDEEAKPSSDQAEVEAKVQTEEATATEAPVPMETDSTDIAHSGEAHPETVEAPIIEDVESAELSAVQPETLVEEPIVEEPISASEDNVPEVERAGSGDKKISANVIVETAESADEAIETLNLEPVVEEASSADELKHADADPKERTNVKASEVISGSPTKKAPTKPLVENPETEVKKDEAPAVVDCSGRRKSGRKVKVPKELAEEVITEESRRLSRRASSRKRPAVAEKAPDVVKEDIAQKDDDASKEHEDKDEVVEDKERVEEAKQESDKADGLNDDEQDIASNQKVEGDKEEEQTTDTAEKVERVDEPMSEEVEESKGSERAVGIESDTEPVTEPSGRLSRSLRVRAPKRPLEEESPSAEPPKKQTKRSRGAAGDLNKSSGPLQSTPTIKLPALKTRMTISTSDPSSRPGASKERATTGDQVTDKQYVCHQCGFATDRLNNIVYHETKSFCQGKSQLAEMMKNDIIRQQQQAKGRRKQAR